MHKFKLSYLDKVAKVEGNNTYTVVDICNERVLLVSDMGIIVNTTISSLLRQVKSRLIQAKPGCDFVIIPDMFSLDKNLKVEKWYMWNEEHGCFM